MTDATTTEPAERGEAEAFVASLRPAPFAVKALNGLNGAVDNLLFIAYELFVLFYYSQVLGLSGTLTGAAILISMIADALTDPVIGSWSDNIRSRFGRRHLFMFASILPICVSFWLLFTPPAALGSVGLFLWLVVTSVAVRVTLTFFSAPASAVTAEISPLKSDRAEMGIYRQIVASVGQFSLLYLAFSIFFRSTPAFENGQENAAAYPDFALALSAIIMVCMLVGAGATFRRIRSFEATLGSPGSSHFNLRRALADWLNAIVRVPNFRAILFGLFFATIMGTTYRAMSIYLGTYLWEFTPAQIKNWQQLVLVGMFTMAIASRFIVPRTDPKKPYLTAFSVLVLMYGLPPLLTALDVLPPAGDPLLAYFLYAFNTTVGACFGVIMICSAVMFSETTDEYHYITRISQTGMIFGLITFGNKAASGLGKVVAGVILDAVGFPEKSEIDQLTPQILDNLAYLLSLVVFLAGAAGLVVLSRYNLDRQRHAEVLAGINRMAAEPG